MTIQKTIFILIYAGFIGLAIPVMLIITAGILAIIGVILCLSIIGLLLGLVALAIAGGLFYLATHFFIAFFISGAIIGTAVSFTQYKPITK